MPYKDPARAKEYDRARAHTKARKAKVRASSKILPFCGIDGEGGYLTPADKKAKRQSYLLLRAGEHVLETGANLTSHECLTFIADLPPDRIYVAYFFDYDVTMMLRDVMESKLRRLMNRSDRINKNTGRAFFVETVWRDGSSHHTGDLRIDYLPHKMFSVQKWTGKEWTRAVIVHDTGTFFQMSFVKTLRLWFPEPEFTEIIDSIEEGKGRRNDIGVIDDYERRYNAMEVKMMALLMERFRDMLDEYVGVTPPNWQGPGNIAACVFRKYGIPKRATRGEPVKGKDLTIIDDYPDVVIAANKAYYGGRFEALQIGEIPGPIHQYDIRSAYPAMYRQLPCLLHGTWKRARRVPTNRTAFGHIKFSHPEPWTVHIGPFPVRRQDGSIVFPVAGEGWYTNAEIYASISAGFRIEWLEGWEYVRHCECDPFHFVPEMFRSRGEGHRKVVLKLALNSMYGKLAQSIGDPVYSNPVWASLITGTVRAQLYSAAISVNDGRDVVMLATDGIFTRSPIPTLPLSPALGDWEYKEHPDMLVLQSGVYIAGDEKPKTRGIPMTKLAEKEPELRRIWREYRLVETMEDPSLRDHWTVVTSLPPFTQITRPTFIGLKLALARNNLPSAGTWPDEVRDVKFNWQTKRTDASMQADGSLFTQPYTMVTVKGEPVPSVYYSKDIGKMASNAEMVKLRMVEDSQPDWNM